MLTRLHIDLDALHHNLAVARELAGGRMVLAPVKADAYGHGLVPVALSIQERGSAEWLGVALVEEGRQLRAAGVTLPILKFSPRSPRNCPTRSRPTSRCRSTTTTPSTRHRRPPRWLGARSTCT
nr:alanine racemase [Tessaracoccus coleopterorum]